MRIVGVAEEGLHARGLERGDYTEDEKGTQHGNQESWRR